MERARIHRTSVAPLFLLTTVFVLSAACLANADQPPASDFTLQLRQVLAERATSKADIDRRSREIEKRLELFRTPAELRDALFLLEWRDADLDATLAAADHNARAVLTSKLERALMEALRSDDATRQLAATQLVSELVNPMRHRQPAGWSLDVFAPVLAELAIGPNPELCRAAAHTLGKLGGDPAHSAGPLGSLLHSDEVSLRRASAEALSKSVDSVMITADGALRSEPDSIVSAALRLARIVLPLAAHGLGDSDTEVRRRCINTIRKLTLLIDRVLADERLTRIAKPQAALADLRTTVELLQMRMPAIAPVLSDLDPEVRRLAHQALENVARVVRLVDSRFALLRPVDRLVAIGNETVAPQEAGVITTQADTRPQQPVENGGAERSLMQGLQLTLPTVACGVNDPDVLVRRASIDVLELLGETAKLESAALVQALDDSDLYVRWSAARTLGNLAPVDPERAVPALAKLLNDVDMDVRYASAESLRRYGPKAQEATPTLVGVINHADPGTGVAAMRALQGIGVSSGLAIPELISALAAPQAGVREAAAQFLGKFGPDARDAMGALRHTLNDEDSGVRRAAGDALLAILESGKERSMSEESSPIKRTSYLGAPTAVVAAVKWWHDKHVIAATPPKIAATSFAADPRTRVVHTGWRAAAPVGTPAVLLAPVAGNPPNPAAR